MRRVFALALAVILLLAAFVPSAFCVAEPGDAARFGQLLTDLEGVDNYATGQVKGWIEEAEALLDSADVQAAYSAEDRAKVPLYRRYYDRDCTLVEFRDAVKLNQYVRFAAGDSRTYYREEWAAITTRYNATIQAVEEAETSAAMRQATTAFFAEVGQLITYDELRARWYQCETAVIGRAVDAFAAKVDAYRTAQGLQTMTAPRFDAYSSGAFVESFEAYAAANTADTTTLVNTLRQGIEDVRALDYYAREEQMSPLLSDFATAVEAAVIEAQDVRSALDVVKDHAMDVLRRAIANSQYVASLEDPADVAFYQQALPELMRVELQSAQTEDEVQAVLAEYLDLLDTPMEGEGTIRPKLDTVAIMAIVTGSLSVVLLVFYFVLRVRNKSKKGDRKGAAEMLAELQTLAAQKGDAVQDVEQSTAAENAAQETEEQEPPSVEETAVEASVEGGETQSQEAMPFDDEEDV